MSYKGRPQFRLGRTRAFAYNVRPIPSFMEFFSSLYLLKKYRTLLQSSYTVAPSRADKKPGWDRARRSASDVDWPLTTLFQASWPRFPLNLPHRANAKTQE